MTKEDNFYSYHSDGVSFFSSQAVDIRTIYFPLCGISSAGIKSSITPFLSGDIKIDRNRYLTKPVSTEDLRNPVRNFFCYLGPNRIVSLAEPNKRCKSFVEMGQLWHRLSRRFSSLGLELEALNFVPVTGEDVELMRISVKNISSREIKIIPTAAVPIFGRALANKHDHENVTSLLHRIKQTRYGVCVYPTMLFNEEGHKPCDAVYYVFGIEARGVSPIGTFPTVDVFLGDTGRVIAPEAVVNNVSPRKMKEVELNGKEAFGAIRFRDKLLAPGEVAVYLVCMGISHSEEAAYEVFNSFNTVSKFNLALEKNKLFWKTKSGVISFVSAERGFDSWMRWVSIQPILRRIFGCSFLPDHDYGKGGRGWRDIWQDLLSLLLIEPENVRDLLINNFAGVRIDGSNATIIGTAPGEFIADRNDITRVWMDHGVWPLATINLYINQTGDYKILLEDISYFRDAHLSRTFEKDGLWNSSYGNKLKDKKGNVYKGSILEHILVQHLVQFFNVGEHNFIRLESADWNDGLDMAFERGESVAFSCFYAGNLFLLADLLEELRERCRVEKVSLATELLFLLDTISGKRIDYNDIQAKRHILFDIYFKSVQPELSGRKKDVKLQLLIKDLRQKAAWMFSHIKKKGKVRVVEGSDRYEWFNGYYDNKGRRIEGRKGNNIRMTLTGQVFAIMSGCAEYRDVVEVIKSVNRFLKDKKLGGLRLNTDFYVAHYFDLGRAFGFAYGTKENGAFFSHMSVMYAYALYSRGFVREGYEVLKSIYKMSVDTDKSKIYPGIPEYFDSVGRGRYHYLTGSASWFVFTELTQVFGVRGRAGDLELSPKLVKEQFTSDGIASVTCWFAGKRVIIEYVNKDRLDYGSYKIRQVYFNDKSIEVGVEEGKDTIVISRSFFKKKSDVIYKIQIILF